MMYKQLNDVQFNGYAGYLPWREEFLLPKRIVIFRGGGVLFSEGLLLTGIAILVPKR